MDEVRCWFCGRDRKALINDLPPGFWDEQQEMFLQVEVIGKMTGLDKVRPGDPPHSRHFHRQDAPEDEVCSFDDRRFAVISRKCRKVSVCRVCRSVEVGLASVSEESKGTVPYRPIYTPGSEELTVARTWEKIRSEERKLASDYPEEAYRVLTAMQGHDPRKPLSLWDLSTKMRVFNHRSLEAPVSHILGQCEELGELDRKNLVLHFRDPDAAPRLIRELMDRYEEFNDHDRRPVQTASQQASVISRIKKLNDPTDTLQYYPKW